MRTTILFVLALMLTSCHKLSEQEDKEKELLKKELELAQKELELKKEIARKDATIAQKNAEIEQHQNMLASEKEHPKQFLKSTGRHWKNLINEWVIEGIIENSSSSKTYKDVVLEVKFLDKNKDIISSQNFVVREIIKPNSQANFRLKTASYANANSLSWNAINAEEVK